MRYRRLHITGFKAEVVPCQKSNGESDDENRRTDQKILLPVGFFACFVHNLKSYAILSLYKLIITASRNLAGSPRNTNRPHYNRRISCVDNDGSAKLESKPRNSRAQHVRVEITREAVRA